MTIDKGTDHSTPFIFDGTEKDERVVVKIQYTIDNKEVSVFNYKKTIFDKINILFCSENLNSIEGFPKRKGKPY